MSPENLLWSICWLGLGIFVAIIIARGVLTKYISRIIAKYVLHHTAWWRRQMETVYALLAICAGNSPVTGEFPKHKDQWRGALMFSLICACINGWVNNREASDLRCHRTHYDVIVMARYNETCHISYMYMYLIIPRMFVFCRICV